MIPNYLSTRTIENTVVIKELFALNSFDPGNIQAKEANGDMVWFTFTNNESFSSVLIFIITPDAALSEYAMEDGEHKISVVINIGEFVEWLRSNGLRKLTTDEWNIWTGSMDEPPDEFPPTSWDESG